MPSDDLGLGLIGCGYIAETQHLPALHALSGIKVIAAADSNAERLKQVSDRFHIEQRYDDYRTLLENRAIDAVAICVPVRLHASVALAALDAGKHLFIEKPLAFSLDECQQLVQQVARSRNQVMVGFNLRCHRLIRRARAVIESGALGRIQAIRSVFSSGTRFRGDAPEWRKRRNLGGGALIEVGIHHYDLWRYLLGSEVEEVFVESRSEEWDDETATVSGKMTNGILASSLLTVASCSDNQIDIYGEKGLLRVSLYHFDGLQFLPSGSFSGDPRIRARRLAQVLSELPAAAPIIAHGGDMVMSYRNLWAEFASAIRHGAPVECSVTDGMRALEIVMAVIHSADCGTPVRVGREEV